MEFPVRFVEKAFATLLSMIACWNQIQEGGFDRHDKHDRIPPFAQQ